MRVVPALLILFLPAESIAYSQEVEGEVELADFILGQYRSAVHRQLGPPLQRIDTEDHWIYEFHKFKPDTSVYGLFKYPAHDTTRLYSIQINGHDYPEMKHFKGLKLGASKDQVDRALGTRYSRTDSIDNPKVAIYFYENKNYSVEIDAQGNLYGIKIQGDIQTNKTKETLPSLSPFKNAVITKNIDSLLNCLAPDVEFYKGDKMLTYTGAAREEFKNPNSSIVQVLLGDTQSIRYVFATEKAEETAELRFYAEKRVSTTVYKFYHSKVLQEIVFTAHAGKWKVWEVRFRK